MLGMPRFALKCLEVFGGRKKSFFIFIFFQCSFRKAEVKEMNE